MNNFKKLLEEEESILNDRPQLRKVQTNLWQTLGVFKFVGQIVEVYVPKMVDLLILAAGGKVDPPDKNNYDIPPSQGSSATCG